MSMIQSKHKEKPARTSWLNSLFAPAQISFTAFLPLDECVTRLQSREKTGFWRSPRTYVALEWVDEETCRFQVRRTGSRYGTYFADGYLTCWDDTHTHVSGEARQSTDDYRALWIVLPVMALFALSIPLRPLAGFIVTMMIAGLMITIWMSAYRRNDLAAMIEQTLGY